MRYSDSKLMQCNRTLQSFLFHQKMATFLASNIKIWILKERKRFNTVFKMNLVIKFQILCEREICHIQRPVVMHARMFTLTMNILTIKLPSLFQACAKHLFRRQTLFHTKKRNCHKKTATTIFNPNSDQTENNELNRPDTR